MTADRAADDAARDQIRTLLHETLFVEAGAGPGMVTLNAAAAERRAGLLHLLAMTPLTQVRIGYAYDPRQPSRAVTALRDALEGQAPP